MQVASFYTPNPPYPELAQRLARSLLALGIPHTIEAVASSGNWKANCMRRAGFLLDLLKRRNEPLLWVDADAVVHSDPRPFLAGLDCDAAFHWLDGKELLGGTMYFRPTLPARQILRRWMDCNIAYPAVLRSQINLQRAVESMAGAAKIAALPAAYCFIFDTMRQLHPDVEPVIEQFQASRRLTIARSA